ncbi:MAG TPA: AAA family ATPase [Stellaceae bacterium]|nr:AAA family ATPase [Stellaceae bacterium]
MRSILEMPAPIEKTTNRLPGGRAPLLAFVSDAATEKALRECLTQLSLANGMIMRGGIAKAIDTLGTERSPNNLIVDISGIDLPISQVHDLAEVCEPGVTVIAIGNRNEIGLYRDLLHAGVTDYIAKPLTPQLIARALNQRTGVGDASPIQKKLGTMTALIGARGGVGTTTLAVNLAWHLANRQSRRVALVDLDLQTGDCALALNVKPSPGLREALVNPTRIDSTLLERVMTPVGHRLFVLSSEEPLRDDLEITAEAVGTLVGALREQFHYVIVDVPRIPATPYRRVLDTADFRIIVGDQTLRSVRDIVRLRDVLGEGNGKQRNGFVVNRYGEGGRHAVTLQEMRHVLGLQPRTVIPFLPTLFAAATNGTRVAAARRGKVTDAIAALVLELSGRPPERRRWWSIAR